MRLGYGARVFVYDPHWRSWWRGYRRAGLLLFFLLIQRSEKKKTPNSCTWTKKQYLEMDDLCTQYASGNLKVTTRQAYQFHGIIKSNLKLAMQGINRAAMDTLAACGDVNRNIIANPQVHDALVYKQVNELANHINVHLKPKVRFFLLLSARELRYFTTNDASRRLRTTKFGLTRSP